MDLYSLKLHEVAIISTKDYLVQTVQRVPGGWLYRTDTQDYNGYRGTSVESFVPFDTDFMVRQPEKSHNSDYTRCESCGSNNVIINQVCLECDDEITVEPFV